jgi:hypothetical protein
MFIADHVWGAKKPVPASSMKPRGITLPRRRFLENRSRSSSPIWVEQRLKNIERPERV